MRKTNEVASQVKWQTTSIVSYIHETWNWQHVE